MSTARPTQANHSSASPDDDREPFHVAVIMDGNGRWANSRGKPRIAGHRAGAEAVRRTVETAPRLGVTTLTLYAFSADNWKRPGAEVRALMDLLRRYLDKEGPRCLEKDIRLSLIGRRDRLPKTVIEAAERVEQATLHCRRLHLRLAVDYSSRQAILDAARSVPDLASLDEREFGRVLSGGAPDVDLLVRTSGEMRLSDFLLWECAYAELYFCDCLWPDFGGDELAAAVEAFSGRDRRFGGLRSAGSPAP